MARGIKRSLVAKALSAAPEADGSDQLDDAAEAPETTPAAFKRASGGAGSAWKAGAVAQAQAGWDEAREQLAKDILSGDHVLEIDPDMISDPIGSDRRQDWMEQEDFRSLVESIRENDQDTPITVWPEAADWQPDALEPTNLERVQFLLLAGRRRCAAAKELGRPVRAVIGPSAGRTEQNSTFEMLVLRFRENEERQALSAFERLLSIGEMFESLKASATEKITAIEFAKRIGVHESIVSRARTVQKSKDKILNAFKNVYDLSFHDLQKALAQLADTEADKPKKKAKPTKLSVVKKVGKRNLTLESVEGKLSVKTTGMKLDKQRLEGLGDLIAEYLNDHGSNQ